MMIKKMWLLFIALCFFSCQSSKDIKTDSVNGNNKQIRNNEFNKTDNYKTIEDTGKIEVYDDIVYYVINWESKSRISLEVTGNLENELMKLKDRIIKAQGAITYYGPWSGMIEITSYEIID
jgi:hypothetical protein